VTDIHDRAWEVLVQHVGHKNPIRSSQLAVALGMQHDAKTGTIQTRAIIRELVKLGLPVGATDEGYFILENRQELEQYLLRRQDRAQEILQGNAYIQRAFEDFYKGTLPDPRPPPIHWVPDPEERE